jgi:hypothetical protein
VSEERRLLRALRVFSLGETRRFVRVGHARMMVAFFAILYALGSMALGGMLLLARVTGGYTTEILWGNALGTGAWNYPGLLIVAPWGVVSLPFLATLSMIVVSIGVGLGVSVAILIAVRLIRDRRSAGARAGAVGSIAGLTPAMIALVTLGACCSTTAAATAGVGLVAQASGSSVDSLLVNNWYLDVFQVAVVYVALLAQELILRVYGGLLGLVGPGQSTAVESPRPTSAREVWAGTLRAGLLLAGLTWSLATLAEWAGPGPAYGSAALWYQWVVQHELLGDFAIAVALFPGSVLSSCVGRSASARAFRWALLVGGVSLVGWTPPQVASAGAPGFVNELLGLAGAPAAWGAVAPVFALGIPLIARWGFQYLLLGGFAVAVALAPARIRRAVEIPDHYAAPRGMDADAGAPVASQAAWVRASSATDPGAPSRVAGSGSR